MNKLDRTSDPYAACRNAIRLFETASNSLGGHDAYAKMIRNHGVTVDDLITRSVDSIRRLLLRDKCDCHDHAEHMEMMSAALPEYDTPAFRRWLMMRVYGFA